MIKMLKTSLPHYCRVSIKKYKIFEMPINTPFLKKKFLKNYAKTPIISSFVHPQILYISGLYRNFQPYYRIEPKKFFDLEQKDKCRATA